MNTFAVVCASASTSTSTYIFKNYCCCFSEYLSRISCFVFLPINFHFVSTSCILQYML